MRPGWVSISWMAAAAALLACASGGGGGEPAAIVSSATDEGPDRVERSNTVEVTAVVESIDQASREVTLRGPQGGTTTVVVDPSVKNLPQVRKGDLVRATYYESLVFQVRKPGEATPGAEAATAAVSAAPGERPAGADVQKITITTTVEAIDRERRTITLRGPQGGTRTLPVQNPANLDKVKVGELVEITYTEAVAISVEKP